MRGAFVGMCVNAKVGMAGCMGSHVCNGNLKMAGHTMHHELCDMHFIACQTDA